MRPLMMLAALTLVSCTGGAPSGTSTADDADPQDTEAAPLADDGGSRDPGTKVEQCERLGAHIEQTETGTTIVNVNDRNQMDSLAGKRRAAAEGAEALVLAEVPLLGLRKRYVALCHQMAEALEGVASDDPDARAAAVEKHNALDAEVATLVDELNRVCGAT